jgi:predicted ribosomally synthesized peptide with nif11-like leader
MITESVNQFWKKLHGDHQLQARLQAQPTGNKQERLAAVVAIAAENGFKFTGEQFEATLKDEVAAEHAAAELRPEHLAQIAGGGLHPLTNSVDCCTTTYCNACTPYGDYTRGDCCPHD